jgi:hypothetical protein
MPNPWLNEHKSTASMNYFLNLTSFTSSTLNFDITEILLKVALKTMPPSNSPLLIIGIRIDDSIAIKYENP